MSLKMRSAVLFGLIVMLLLSIAFFIIYFQSASFRKNDFQLRLKQKAQTHFRLLAEPNRIDSALLFVIDSTSINKLVDERVFLYDESFRLMYSSPGKQTVLILSDLLNDIAQKKYVEFSEGQQEGVGLYVDDINKKGIAIATANDVYGKRKLKNLFFTLCLCWIGSIFITAFASYFYVKRIFNPLDKLNEKIQEITESNLQQRVELEQENNELTLLAANFNKMLDRLQQSFAVQKSFLQHASHELRTPLSNLLIQTEGALERKLNEKETRSVLLSIYDDQKYLVDMVNSILLLSKYEQSTLSGSFEETRIDEIIFDAAGELKSNHHEYLIHIDFAYVPTNEKELTVFCNQALLKVAFMNLIRNACAYSNDHSVQIIITPGPSQILISLNNTGSVIPVEERDKLFIPFFRGTNVSGTRGHGLGLSICKRIIDVHKGQLFYNTPQANLNCFTVLISNI